MQGEGAKEQRRKDLLFEFDGPVGVVEELLPAAISFSAEMDVDEWIAFGFDRRFDKGYTCLFWSSAAFSDVAAGAGANDIVPG